MTEDLSFLRAEEERKNDRCYGKFNREDFQHILMEEAANEEARARRARASVFLFTSSLG